MITAKNYVAQAEKSLRWFGSKLLSAGHYEDGRAAHSFVGKLVNAVHFVMPDEGKIFDDNLAQLQGRELRLPFPRITIEYYTPAANLKLEGFSTQPAEKRLVLCEECEEGIKVHAAWNEGNLWAMGTSYFIVPRMWQTPEAIIEATEKVGHLLGVEPPIVGKRSRPDQVVAQLSGPYVVCPKLLEAKAQEYGGQLQARKQEMYDVIDEVGVLLNMLEALACENVTTETFTKGDRKGSKRHGGTLPVYETKMLTLLVPAEASRGEHQGGTHASPRMHLRRGHVRRYASGRAVWIESCVVGKASDGVIDKSYALDTEKG